MGVSLVQDEEQGAATYVPHLRRPQARQERRAADQTVCSSPPHGVPLTPDRRGPQVDHVAEAYNYVPTVVEEKKKIDPNDPFGDLEVAEW